MIMAPYDRFKARVELVELFQPLFSDPTSIYDAKKHLSILRSMADTLPLSLKPTKSQLSMPHFYGIDMLVSPSLRDRLIGAGKEVAESFVNSIASCGGKGEDIGQVIICGDDPMNEMSWELSQGVLSQWNWLLGPTCISRANFWRRQRGAPLLPEAGSGW